MLLIFIAWLGLTVVATSAVVFFLVTVGMPLVLIVGAAQPLEDSEAAPA